MTGGTNWGSDNDWSAAPPEREQSVPNWETSPRGESDAIGASSTHSTAGTRSRRFRRPKFVIPATALAVFALVGVFAVTSKGSGPGNSVAGSPVGADVQPPVPSPVEDIIDPYQQPKDMESLIRTVSASTVTVFCGNGSGSGWVVDLDDDPDRSDDDAYPYEIITNHHVIAECVGGGAIEIRPTGSHLTYSAQLWSADEANDSAVLMTGQFLPPLPLASGAHTPKVGNWVMAVGSPGSSEGLLEGSVTSGHITNIQPEVIISDVTINPGNSGGPLVNVWGEVVATNTAKDIGEAVSNISYSFPVKRLCANLVRCDGSSSN